MITWNKNLRTVLPVFIVLWVLPLTASGEHPALDVEPATGELVVTSADGSEAAKLLPGTIGKAITTDGLQFKVSYGRNLRDQISIIVYPDPEKPQTLALQVLGRDVVISEDSVLTLTAAPDLGAINYQAGLLGTVTVAGQTLADGSGLQFQGPEVVDAGRLSATVTTRPEPVAVHNENGNGRMVDPNFTFESGLPKPAEPEVDHQISDEQRAAFQIDPLKNQYAGGKVRDVEGEVMVSGTGTDVLEMLRDAADVPRLQVGDDLTVGTTIQTGPDGKVMFSPFPGSVVALQPNTVLSIQELDYDNGPSGAIRKVRLYLQRGGVVGILEGLDPATVDFTIATELGQAQAMGTTFGVWHSLIGTLIIVNEKVVRVETPQGVFLISVLEGNKFLITRETTPENAVVVAATPQEMEAFMILRSAARQFLARNDIPPRFTPGPELAEQVRDAAKRFRDMFDPRLNPDFMTPFLSQGD